MTDQTGQREADEESRQRLARLCEMSDALFDGMTPAQRDRIQQTHLAAARGPMGNLRLLCEMTNLLIRLRRGSPNGKPR